MLPLSWSKRKKETPKHQHSDIDESKREEKKEDNHENHNFARQLKARLGKQSCTACFGLRDTQHTEEVDHEKTHLGKVDRLVTEPSRVGGVVLGVRHIGEQVVVWTGVVFVSIVLVQ